MAKSKKVEKAKVVVVNEDEERKLAESLETVELKDPETLESFYQKLEANRSDFYKAYNSQRKISNILMPVAGIAMAGSLVLFVGIKELWGKIAGGVLIGVTLVGMIVYYILTRNKLPNKSKQYIRNFALLSDNYVFNHQDYSNKKALLKKHYALSDFIPDRVYKNIIDLASRNIVEVDYKGHAVQVGEAALYKQGAKKHQKALLFVGKYMSFANDYHFEDRYIINIKGDKATDLPDDIDDLVVLKEQNRFVVYGKEGAKSEKDLGKDVINDLMSIDCKNSLFNVNVVVWAGHTAVYLSYDDGIVSIPLDKSLDQAAYQQLKQNILQVLEIFLSK